MMVLWLWWCAAGDAVRGAPGAKASLVDNGEDAIGRALGVGGLEKGAKKSKTTSGRSATGRDAAQWRSEASGGPGLVDRELRWAVPPPPGRGSDGERPGRRFRG